MFEVLFLVVTLCGSNGECQQYAIDQFNPHIAAEARECQFRAAQLGGDCVRDTVSVEVSN